MSAEIEKGLSEIWEHLLKVSPIGADDDFFDLGGSSLQGVEMIMEIEQRFGTELPVSILANTVTITCLTTLIDGAPGKEAPSSAGWHQPDSAAGTDAPARPQYSPVLVPLRAEGAKTPLFLAHGVGLPRLGGKFVENLDPDQPAYMFQPRGIDGKGKLSRSIEEMAADYIQAMQEVQPEGPYFLGGVCAGAYTALEMAHQLGQRDVLVPMLILLDPPTILHAVRRPWYDLWYAKRLAGFVVRKVARAVKPSKRRPDTWVKSVIERRARMPAFAGADKHTRVDRVVDMQTKFTRALRTYRPQPFPGVIHLICARGPNRLDRQAEMIWSRVHDDVRLHVMGETHNELLQKNLPDIARHTQRWLDEFTP